MSSDRLPQRFTPPQVSPELRLSDYLPSAAKPRGSEIGAPLPSPPIAAIAGALDRLEEMIEGENQALATHQPADFADINRRKSQSLLEITRLGRTLPPGGNPALRVQLGRVRDKLVRNQRVLGLHLAAVREIADLMVGVLGETESDGTYDKPHRAGRR